MARTSPPTTDSPSFGALLRVFRQREGMTQEDLVERAGLSVRAVSDLERGIKHWPQRQTVELLEDALRLAPPERTELEGSIRRRRHVPPVGSSPFAPIPRPLTSLIGRERDVAEAVHRLRWGGVRLLTLTRPGGVGKTRLAIEVASLFSRSFQGDVAYVSLSALRHPGLVGLTIMSALGVQESVGRTPLELLVDSLKSREVFLVLDNFEQVMDAADLLAELLAACPQLRMVVTSRVSLRLRGESRLEILPLEMPPRNDLNREMAASYPAMELFVERARAVKRDFSQHDHNLDGVLEICRRLDGLPLAIELAAARIVALPLPELLMRLEGRLRLLSEGPRDLPDRQRSMRATIAWSYDLLDQPARELLRRLSVFAGGWVLEAAAAVCGSTEDSDLLPTLETLVESSLVMVEIDEKAVMGRYRMLETVREYASELLESSGEATQVRARHAAYLAALAQEAEDQMRGPDQIAWLARLEAELANLRVALAWAIEIGDSALVLRIAGPLYRFWYMHGHITEGRAWLDAALTLDQSGDKSVRANALHCGGMLAWQQAEYARATTLHQEALVLRREVGDREGEAGSLGNLGLIAWKQGDYGLAARLEEEAVQVSREIGYKRGITTWLTNLGAVAHTQGDFQRARQLYEEALLLKRELGDRQTIAVSLDNLGLVALFQGDYTRARAMSEEGLALRRELGDQRGIACSLNNLGAIVRDQGENERAGVPFRESMRLSLDLGEKRLVLETLEEFAGMVAAQGKDDGPRVSGEWPPPGAVL